MDWTRLLKAEAADAYRSAEGLMALVEEKDLGWKPATGSNWMTVSQLLMHMTSACGFCCRGFVTGDWGMPEGMKAEDMKPEDMLPPAEKMPAVDSLDQAKHLLAEDKRLAWEMIDRAGEADLAGKTVAAPWNPGVESSLGHHLLQMIGHLNNHKAQLFYYLKLRGKPVHTGHYYGMA